MCATRDTKKLGVQKREKIFLFEGIKKEWQN